LRPATVVKRVERVQALFRDALRRELVSKNPFETLKRPKVDASDRQVYVPAEVVERLIDATPDLEWKLLLAIVRYLGLRVPSEPFSLTWADVDWEQSRLRVPFPKTEVHGKPYRVVPIVPPVRPHLEAVWEAAEPGQVFIFHRLRQRESLNAANRGWWANVNLRQHLLRLIARIGEQPWPRLWHSLRASAETDLVARFPLHVVTAWMGNTSKVATKHYLRVTPQDYTRAITEAWNGGTESGTRVAQKAAQNVPAPSSKHSEN
jgi:integrase